MLLLNESGSWFTGFAARWAGRVAAKAVAAAISDDPLVSAVIEATLEAMTERSSSTRQRRASTWYRTYPNAGDRAELGLRLLSDHFRAGGTSREHAERYLVRALLADLTDAYAGVRAHLQRLGRPLVLVDNAQGPPGRELIEQVLRDRAEGIADQVAFIAAVRGSGGRSPLRNAVRRDLRETAQRTRWTPGDTASSQLHWGAVAGADFFTTEVWTWRGLVTFYTVFVIDLASRRVQIVGSTPHPNDLFMRQVARTLTAMAACCAIIGC